MCDVSNVTILLHENFCFRLKQKLIIKRSPKAGSDGDTEFKAISSVESQTLSNASSPTVDDTGSRSQDEASRSQFDDDDEFFVSGNNTPHPEMMDTDDSCKFSDISLSMQWFETSPHHATLHSLNLRRMRSYQMFQI